MGTLWGEDKGKKVPPRTRRGRDKGAGAGDRIPTPNPPHCHPYFFFIMIFQLPSFLFFEFGSLTANEETIE